MDVLEPRYRWVFPDHVEIGEDAAAAASRHGLSERVGRMLIARGVPDAPAIDAFFGDPLEGLHDAALLPDIDLLLGRLALARERHERVLVFGDFDADGLTGLAIMVLALERYGLGVEPYVPSRLDEGHGLSIAALDRAEAVGATVIITVDCGATSHAEIAEAGRRGLDVIVTDHHRVPTVMPSALAVVDPHRPDSIYPDRRLAGSGVAFKIAGALLRDLPGGPAWALGLADLATIGTVADVAPVVGENRAIARLGLGILRGTPRPGIAAILERANVAPEAVDLETVSFAIAPRLNAAGRVGEAVEAARLLLATTAEDAGRHADALEAANLERRDLLKAALVEARAAAAIPAAAIPAAAIPAATLIHGPWSVGIVGLLAARLVEDLGRPAVVGSDQGESIRASCRSDGSMDLGAALEACGDLFTRYGGHAGAAGFELPAADWDAFCARFQILADATAPVDPRVPLRIDLVVPALEVDYGFLRELAGLAPYGPGNPDPLVAVLGMTVTRVRAATGGHSQLTLRRDRDVLDGIAFGRADLAEVVREGDRLDIVARLVSRKFGGLETLQLEIRDAAPAGAHPGLRVDAAAAAPGSLAGVGA
jgi:single-stranded-DNA-specific exonuclease